MAADVTPEVTSLTVLRERLIAAEAAYERLMTGKQPKVIIDSNGERVEFTAVSSDKLRQYVLDLQRQIAQIIGRPSQMTTRPLRFVF